MDQKDNSKNSIPFFGNKNISLKAKTFVGVILLLIICYPMLAKKKVKQPTKRIVEQESKSEFNLAEPETPVATEKSKKTEEIDKLVQGEINKENEEFTKEQKSIDKNESLDDFQLIANIFPFPINISQNSKGNIWLATMQDVIEFPEGQLDNPVKRMDAHIYDNLYNSDLQNITSFYVDEENIGYAGLQNGKIIKYSNLDWKNSWEPGDPIADRIKAQIKYQNFIYIGSKGLWKWDLTTNKMSRFKAFIEANVKSFLRAKSGQIFMSTQNSIWQITSKGWEEFYTLSPERSKDTNFNLIADYQTNGILIGTNHNLMNISSSGIANKTYLEGEEILAVETDNDNNVWIGSNQGLKYYDNKQWYELNEKLGLPGNKVNNILIDNQDRIWLGIIGKGVFIIKKDSLLQKLKQNKFIDKLTLKNQSRKYLNACRAAETELEKVSTSGNVNIRTIDNTSYVFFNTTLTCPRGTGYLNPTTNELLLVKSDHIKVIRNNQEARITSSPSNEKFSDAKAIYPDSAGRIWTTFNNNLYYVLNDTWTKVENPMMAKSIVNSIIQDKQNRIWVASNPIVNRNNQQEQIDPPLHVFENNNWAHYSLNEGLTAWNAYSLALDPQGDIVVGTNNGVFKVSNNQVINLDIGNSLKAKNIADVIYDNLGVLWMAHLYSAKNLSWFDGATFQSYSELDKLETNVSKLSVDSSNDLWLLETDGAVEVVPRKYFIKQ